MSQASIQPGGKWIIELAAALDETSIGILCLTKEAQTSPWFLFEAGALSISLQSGRVVPVLIDLQPGDVIDPLAQFQGVLADREGIEKLLALIAEINPNSFRPVRTQDEVFHMWWPRLELAIAKLREASRLASSAERNLNRVAESF